MALPLRYSVGNLFARRTRTALTLGVVAVVVLATTLLLSLVSSLRRTLVTTGAPGNLIVMRKGATNDGSSALPLEAYQALRYFEGIAKGTDGEPLVSPELVVQPFFLRRDGGRENVLVRGVEPVALAVHDSVRIVEGRMFEPSSGEVIVGNGVAGRYAGAAVGEQLRVRARHLEGGRPLRERRRLVRERGVGRRARARARREAPAALLGPARARGAPAPTSTRSRAGSTTSRAGRSRRSARPTYYAEQSKSAERALPDRDRARRAVGHRRDLRRHQHALRERAGAHRRDRHAARARLLARRDPLRVPDRVAADGGRRASRSAARSRAMLAAAISSALGGVGFAAVTFTTNVIDAARGRGRSGLGRGALRW